MIAGNAAPSACTRSTRRRAGILPRFIRACRVRLRRGARDRERGNRSRPGRIQAVPPGSAVICASPSANPVGRDRQSEERLAAFAGSSAGRWPRLTYAYVLGLVFAALWRRRPAAPRRRADAAARCAGPAPKLRALDVPHRLRRRERRPRRLARARQRPGAQAADSVVFEGAPGGADDVAVAPRCARSKTLRRRARAAHRRQRPGRCSSPPTAPSPRPPPSRSRSTPPARPRRAAGDTLGIDVEVAGATASSTAPSAWRQVSYLVHGAQPADVAVELDPHLRRRRRSAAGSPGSSSPRRRRPSPGTASPAARCSATAATPSASPPPPPSGATASSAQAPPAWRARRRAPGSFALPAPHLPDPRPAQLRHRRGRFGGGRGPPGPGHLRHVRHAAGRGPRRRRQVQAVPRRRAGNYLVIDGEDDGLRLRLHAPARAVARRQGRPRLHRPADRLRRRHRRRRRLPPALRGLDGAGLVQRRPPDRPAAALQAWDKTS